jgi:hypothetical protein
MHEIWKQTASVCEMRCIDSIVQDKRQLKPKHGNVRGIDGTSKGYLPAHMYIVSACSQGICNKEAPSDIALESHNPPQCVLKVAGGFLRIIPDNATIVVSSLHIFAAPGATRSAPLYTLLDFQSQKGQAWISNVTLQGTGDQVRGLEAHNHRIFVEGVTTYSFGASMLRTRAAEIRISEAIYLY